MQIVTKRDVLKLENICCSMQFDQGFVAHHHTILILFPIIVIHYCYFTATFEQFMQEGNLLYVLDQVQKHAPSQSTSKFKVKAILQPLLSSGTKTYLYGGYHL